MASVYKDKVVEVSSTDGSASAEGEQQTEKEVEMRSADNKAVIRALSGKVYAEVSPVPATVQELKVAVEEQSGTPILLQRLIKDGETQVLQDGEVLPDESISIMMVIAETAMWEWDLAGNPARNQIEVDGPHVKCPKLRTDYVNVLTKEPVRKGKHYFEFVMHYIGDEQSCGLVADPYQAGSNYGLRSLTAWTYYPGRMGSSGGDTRDGCGALHAQGRAVAEFKKLKRSGDVIGMLVDMEAGALAFSLNGELQGACPIPTDRPLYVLTHVDTDQDYVELRKPNLQEAPPAHLDALNGALLDISKGLKLRYGFMFSDSDGSAGSEADSDGSDGYLSEEIEVDEGD